MSRLITKIPYSLLVPVALLLGLAPFRPEPHLVEKVRMLFSGELARPVDIFDLCLHGLPVLLLSVRVCFSAAGYPGGKPSPPGDN